MELPKGGNGAADKAGLAVAEVAGDLRRVRRARVEAAARRAAERLHQGEVGGDLNVLRPALHVAPHERRILLGRMGHQLRHGFGRSRRSDG